MKGRESIGLSIFLAAALVAAAPSCVVDPAVELGRDSRPIIDGTIAGKDELKSVGGILTNAGTICTGSLITPTVVLTAAHCVEPQLIRQGIQAAGGTPPETIEYYFSFDRVVDVANPSSALPVESVLWHPEFLKDFSGIFDRPGTWHDVALMYLVDPVEDRPYQRIASTATIESIDMEGNHLVAGFGLTNDADPLSAGTLTKGVSTLEEVGDTELIAGVGNEQQACRGDSGGPIFSGAGEDYQIGIASRINADLIPPPSEPPPCETGLLYTRVDAYRGWLEENVPEFMTHQDPEDPKDPENPENPDDPENPEGDGGGDGGCRVAASSSSGGLLLLGVILAVARRRRWSIESR